MWNQIRKSTSALVTSSRGIESSVGDSDEYPPIRNLADIIEEKLGLYYGRSYSEIYFISYHLMCP